MTTKEWRNHTDERIAALFDAQEESTKRIEQMQAENAKQSDKFRQDLDAQSDKFRKDLDAMRETFAEDHRRSQAKIDRNTELINELITTQIQAAQRMDRLEVKIDQVIDKVDSWLDSLRSQNGKK
jgi:hypothetical protein